MLRIGRQKFEIQYADHEVIMIHPEQGNLPMYIPRDCIDETGWVDTGKFAEVLRGAIGTLERSREQSDSKDVVSALIQREFELGILLKMGG